MNHNTDALETSLIDTKPLPANVAERLLTTTEAAAHLGLTVDKLANLRHRDVGPGWVQLGRTIRYIPDDLNWWIEQCRAKSN